ncbi:hypothetical protein T265_07416 [Opisthorchis viverrini]|uniref:Transposase domain-containing protein n=1 Tax=Opisthorchis viverrini TaxID=6198 RepID=A0A075ABJ0_OPIVI|nr:hypothetical protein T265_07416 [Opisthorchis viverrini]KER25019.1 hypothetical protein T265_07416 [Opisthorchis viverrini]
MAVATKPIPRIVADPRACCLHVFVNFYLEEWWTLNRKLKRARELALEQPPNSMNARDFHRADQEIDSLAHNEQQNEADNEEENLFQPSLADIFRDWMISTNVPFSTVNRLLVSLQHKLPELPRDARTLMRTPRSCPTREVPPGEYIHLGIANGLRRVVPMYLPPQPHIIHLHMNVDGMKLHNNGTTVIWPILARIVRPFTSPVFLVGLYGGVRKPEDVCTYLHDVVQELEDLLRLGVVVNDLHHQVVLDAIICDKPARSFVTRMRAHNSYYGCDKCCIKGQYFQTKITFPYGQHVLRTDNSIRRDTRNSPSPFFTLPIDFVHCFPIDYMHAVCLGVVRRLVSIFVNGDRPVRIGPAGLNRVDRMIRNIRAHMPVEFPRKCREITLYKQWKATEFRQLLFYIGPIVFKDILPHERYQNFIDLFISVYFLSHRRFSVSHIDYAR